MSNIVGLDLSYTGTGIIVMNEIGKTILRDTIKTTTALPDRQRLVKIADELCAILLPYNPEIIVKEAPAFGATFAVHVIGQVHGAVDYAMEKAHLPTPISVSPSTLKKFATGRGVGEKGDIKMWVLEKWGEKFSDNNQSDAYVLARIAGIIGGHFSMTSKHEGECLKTILSGNGMDAAAKAIRLSKNDMRVCACGKKMKTGMEMETGKCAVCLRGEQTTSQGAVGI